MRTLTDAQSLQAARGPTPEIVVPPKASVIVHLQFVPPPPSQWESRAETMVEGQLVLHYPGGNKDQSVQLRGHCFRPSLALALVPKLLRGVVPDDRLPWAAQPLPVVDFGYVHAQSSIKATRNILFSNESCVSGKWLCYVGRAKRKPPELGITLAEVEEHGASDTPDVFNFDVVDGWLCGPTKTTAYPHAHMPPRPELRVIPLSRTLPSAYPHVDENRYLPTQVVITFTPERDLLYKSRFRVQVEGGQDLDFICRGCGSYDEDDDVVEVEEA